MFIFVSNPAFLFLQVLRPGSRAEHHAVQTAALLRQNSGITRSAGMRRPHHLRPTRLAQEVEKPHCARVHLQERSGDALFTNKAPGERHPDLHSAGVQDLGRIEPEFGQGGRC